MTEPITDSTITDMEMANLRNSLNLIRSQLRSDRIDRTFMLKQIDKLDRFLERLSVSHLTQGDNLRIKALYDVSRVLGSSLDLQVVLDQVMDAIIRLTGAERGFLMLRDDDGGVTVKAARNFDKQTIASDDFKFSRTVTNRVLDTSEPILTTNATEDPRFAGQASIVSQSLRSIMATPLRARGSAIGVVYVDSRALAGLFSEDDLDALEAFSAQAAIAIDNAMLFSATDEALSRRVDELNQLRRIDMQISETLDVEKALAITLDWACRLAQADTGFIGLVERENQRRTVRTVHHYGFSRGTAPNESLLTLYPQIKDVVRRAEAVNGQSAETGLAYVIVPIVRDQDVMSVVVLENHSGTPFSAEQIDLVERVVTRASVAIENGRLYAAVQAADRAKSEFVGIVAHDLKSPMTGIKGYAELLMMVGSLTDQQANYVSKISDTVERMEMLVSDLADISRIESGHFFMEERRFPTNSVIQAVKDGTLPQIRAREHRFVEQIEPNLPDLYTDYYRLLQILINLISNAYKYTPDGGTITLSARQIGQRVEFSVADTGIGMTAEQIARLGTKFWRAEDEYTRSQPGTGLGFSITKSLIHQMGDTIRIESEPGQGSRFTFTVPIADPR